MKSLRGDLASDALPVPYTLPGSIPAALEQFDEVIEVARDERDAGGIFAAIYRGVTVRVQQDIDAGMWADGARMEEFDCRFAGRWLEAVHRYRQGVLPTESWLAAFMVADHPDLTILQHLLVAVNAHMNLDLGVAAAETAPGERLAALEGDFFRINDLLANLIDRDRLAVHRLSPAIRWVDRLGVVSNGIVRFSIERARDQSWGAAQRLSVLDAAARAAEIRQLDQAVSGVAYVVVHPGVLAATVLERLVKRREEADVRRIIDVLREVQPTLAAPGRARRLGRAR